MFELLCKKCGVIHDGLFGRGEYCSRSCANSRTIVGIKKTNCIVCGIVYMVDKRTSNKKTKCDNCKKINNRKKKESKICKICGGARGKCIRQDICNSNSAKQLIKSMIKYFGFDSFSLGTLKAYEEFDKIKSIMLEDYFDKEMSTVQIQEKYNCLNQRVYKLLYHLTEGKLRGLGSAQSIALKTGRRIQGNGYTRAFKHITWDNRQVVLRSSYETHLAKQLDEAKIFYETEKIKISYWDTQTQKQRTSIVDFFIPEQNLLIEIKSTFTLDLVNMKDRIKAYKEYGYNFKLILNKQETNIDTL